MCDGCGRVATGADPTNEDPARTWWRLAQGCSPDGFLHLGSFSFAWPTDDDTEPEEPEELEYADRHFCTITCLRDWLNRREDVAA